MRVTYHDDVVSLREIKRAIESLEYKVKGDSNISSVKGEKAVSTKEKLIDILTIFVILYILYMIANKFGLLNVFNVFPEAKAGMSFGVLFVIGILTSVHCVAMCGGINLSQCVPQKVETGTKGGINNLMPSILYNAGRVVSYTIIGGVVGA
ncbi:MAG: heavy metal transport/detoxification protein, partial [Erysipelotrichaceae bacterium]